MTPMASSKVPFYHLTLSKSICYKYWYEISLSFYEFRSLLGIRFYTLPLCWCGPTLVPNPIICSCRSTMLHEDWHTIFFIEKWQPETPKHTKASGTWNARENVSTLPRWQTLTYTKALPPCKYMMKNQWKARYSIVLTRCQCLVCVDQKDAFASCGHVASSHSCFRCSSRFPLTLVVFGIRFCSASIYHDVTLEILKNGSSTINTLHSYIGA
jgi:hypothetical protein